MFKIEKSDAFISPEHLCFLCRKYAHKVKSFIAEFTMEQENMENNVVRGNIRPKFYHRNVPSNISEERETILSSTSEENQPNLVYKLKKKINLI